MGISGLQNLETLKASGMESEFFSHWAGHWTKVVNAEQDLEVPNQILNILALLLQTLTVALILGIGGLRVMEGSLTLGMLVAFQSLVQSIQRPASSLIRSLKVLQDCIAHLVQLDEVFSYPLDQNLDENQPAPDRNSRTHKVPDLPLTVQNGADELSNSGARSVPVSSPIFSGFGDWSPDYYPVNFLQEKRLRGFIELQGVTFGYTQVAAPLIQQVTFSVQPGQLIGVIGPNGSGKSTLAKLICGLYQPGVEKFCLISNPGLRLIVIFWQLPWFWQSSVQLYLRGAFGRI
ncbi:MAG: ATP-binding cassette domain-containing protein [Oscillatoriales cyanobacterium RM1_1_9]|nr:ATP-binding cassette domain-containing protein [Oscillatoriales cyanobacterium RM1_1_9]